MSTLRKSFAIALMIAMSGTMAHAEPKLAAKDIVIVHGALVDGSAGGPSTTSSLRMVSM